MSQPVILFVDDEPQLLDGLRLRLRRYRDRWELLFAMGGRAALDLLEQRGVDVILSDLRMPDLDGAELLNEVRQRWPHATRIALSGQADADLAARAAFVSQQFLAKPCEPGQIEAVLERVVALREAVGSAAVRQFVGGLHCLLPESGTYARLTAATRDETTTIDTLAEIVSRDQAVCAKVLQIANSAYFRLARTISTAREAVIYLGQRTLRHLCLAAEMYGGLRASAALDDEVRYLQEHALTTAQAATSIVAAAARDDAFVAGLLHDVGKLVLLQAQPDYLREARDLARQLGGSLCSAEREVYGADHAQVGGYLLGLWGLPVPIVEAVTYHHEPDRHEAAGLDLVAAVHLANGLLCRHAQAAPEGACPPCLSPAYLARTGQADRLDEWRRQLTRDRTLSAGDALA